MFHRGRPRRHPFAALLLAVFLLLMLGSWIGWAALTLALVVVGLLFVLARSDRSARGR